MTETIGTRTPWHLWVIGIVALLWNAVGAMDFVMTQTKNEDYMGQFSAEQLEFFYGFPLWVNIAWAVAVWGGVLGSFLLLLRRRLAVPVFGASLLAMLVTSIQNYALSNGVEVSGTGALIFSAVIFVIAVLLWRYASVMARQRVLR